MIQNAYLCSAQPLKLVQTFVPNCKFACTLWLCFYCSFQFSAKYEGQYFQVELVSKELNRLAAILHVYAGVLNSMK